MSEKKEQTTEFKGPFIDPDQLTPFVKDGRHVPLKEVNAAGLLSYAQVAAMIDWGEGDHTDKETYIHRSCYAWNVPLEGNRNGFCYSDSIEAFLTHMEESGRKRKNEYKYWVGDQIYFRYPLKSDCYKCEHENNLVITQAGGHFYCENCKTLILSVGHADPCGERGTQGITGCGIDTTQIHDELYKLDLLPDITQERVIREKKKKLPRKIRAFSGFQR